MRNKHTIKILLAMVSIISSLFFSSISVLAVENADRLTIMKLSKVQGTVAVLDTANKPTKTFDNMKISSGHSIVTNVSSYAWINLDNDKMVKLDALSKVKVTKDEKNLTIDVNTGKIFIDVSNSLGNGKDLIVRTPSVKININGEMSAEIDVKNGNTTIVDLDGKIDCVVTDESTGQLKQVEILSGKKVEIQPNASEVSIVTKPATKNDISGFSKLQIAQDSVLKERIVQASGSKIGNISEKEAMKSLSQDMNRQATELAAMAKGAGTDSQSVINSMMGADVSLKYVEQPVISEQEQSSDSEQTHIHSYEIISYTPATCNLEGSRVLRCSECGYSITEPISITGHNYNDEVETKEECSNPYNCQDYDIIETRYCTACESYVEQPSKPKFEGHSLDNGTEIVIPTCNKLQKIEYACTNILDENGTRCTYTETVEIPGTKTDAHEYGSEKTYLKSDLCYCYTCNECGKESDGVAHSLGDTSGLPTENTGDDQYIKCEDSGCSMNAVYSWSADDEEYEFTDSWVELPLLEL